MEIYSIAGMRKERRKARNEAVGIIRGDRSGDYLVIDVICKIEIKILNVVIRRF